MNANVKKTIRSFRTWDFIKLTASLDEDVQQIAEKRYRNFFGQNDRHPALGGSPIHTPPGQEDLWCVEICGEYRALATLIETPDTRIYVWFWIGTQADEMAPRV